MAQRTLANQKSTKQNNKYDANWIKRPSEKENKIIRKTIEKSLNKE